MPLSHFWLMFVPAVLALPALSAAPTPEKSTEVRSPAPPVVSAPATGESRPWRLLFNGRDLDGWDMFLTNPDPAWEVPGLARDATGKYLEPIGRNRDPLHVFTVDTVDGEPALHVSGQGFGVITTRESFGNCRIRLQYKWGEKKWGSKAKSPRDAGLLYYVHGEPGFDHATWPRSIECQIQEHDTGDLFALSTQITVNARKEEDRRWLYDPAGTPTLFVGRHPSATVASSSPTSNTPMANGTRWRSSASTATVSTSSTARS